MENNILIDPESFGIKFGNHKPAAFKKETTAMKKDIFTKELFQEKALPNEIAKTKSKYNPDNISTKVRLRRKLEDYLRKYATEKQMEVIAKQWGIEL